MEVLKINVIKEITEQLDCGFRAFIHKTTGEFIFVPNLIELPHIDLESWSEELDILEENFIDYHEIEKWTSNEAFALMSDFADQLTDNELLQRQLITALSKKKPFREFKFEIDNSGEYRQKWFDYKNKRQQDFVELHLKRIKQFED